MNRIINLACEVIPNVVPEQVTDIVKPCLRFIQNKASDADAHRSVPEIIESRGFKSEAHKILTKDGYILTLHRIINPLAARKGIDAEPILLGHGMAAHAGHWLINSDDGHLEPFLDENQNQLLKQKNKKSTDKKISNNLGFVLANLGYDVWLANWRGNRYSKHKKFSQDDSEFWDFTIDDIAEHDLPAFILFILKKTSKGS